MQTFFNKSIKSITLELDENLIKIEEYKIALEKIKKFSKIADEKDKKVLNLAITTLEKRLSSLKVKKRYFN